MLGRTGILFWFSLTVSYHFLKWLCYLHFSRVEGLSPRPHQSIDRSCSNSCQVLSHCGFNLHVPKVWWGPAHFHVSISFLRTVFWCPLATPNRVVFLLLRSLEFFIYFGHELIWRMTCKYVLLICGLSFSVSFTVQSLLIPHSPPVCLCFYCSVSSLVLQWVERAADVLWIQALHHTHVL